MRLGGGECRSMQVELDSRHYLKPLCKINLDTAEIKCPDSVRKRTDATPLYHRRYTRPTV